MALMTINRFKSIFMPLALSLTLALLCYQFLTKEKEGIYIKLFGGYIFIEGDRFIHLERLSNFVLLITPFVKGEYDDPLEYLNVIVGRGAESKMEGLVNTLVRRLELTKNKSYSYKHFKITEYVTADESLYVDDLVLSHLTTVYFEEEFLILFGDYYKGDEDYFKYILNNNFRSSIFLEE